MITNSKNMFENVIVDLKEYVSLQREYWKLASVEKISLIVSFTIIILISIGAFFFASIYFSVALVFLLKGALGSFVPALFIVSGINLLIIVLTVAFRKVLFFNPMVRMVSKLFK